MATFRAKPPKGAMLNRADPLGKMLVRSWWFDDRCGASTSGKFRDRVANELVTSTRAQSDTKAITGQHGHCYQFGADGGGATIQGTDTLSKWGIGATSLTVFARVASFGSNPNLETVFSGSGGFKILSSRRLSADTDGFALMWSTASLTNYWCWGADGSGQFVGATWSPGGALTAGQYYNVCGTYQRDTSIGTYGGTWKLYVDGVLRATNNQVLAGSFGGTFADRIPYFHGTSDTATTIADKRYEVVHVFKSALSYAQVQALNADPFRMFRRRYVPVPIKPSAATGNRRRRLLIARAA